MDEKHLSDTLSHLKAPEPSEKAKNQAVAAALTAFDENLRKKTQGAANQGRLTGINQLVNDVRRMIMQKRYVMSGLAGGVAVCALVAVMGAPFIQRQVDRIAPVKSASDTKGNFSRVSQNMVSSKSSLPFSDLFARESDSAVALGGKEIAVQGKDLAAPVQERPMDEWRKTEASRVEMEAKSDLGKAKDAAVLNESLADKVARRQAPAASEAEVQIAAPAVLPAPSPVPAQALAAGGLSMNMVAPVSPPVAGDDLSQSYYKDQGRDKFEDFEENAVKQVAEAPVSTFSIDVDTSSYSFMRRQLNSGLLPQKDAVRIEELINYFDYSYALPEKGGHPFMPTIAVYDAPWKQGSKVIHIGIKGYDLETKPRSNLVFLIDTSGSMNSPDKLPLLVSSFKMMLDSLQPDDTVGIVVYAGSAGTVLEPTKVSDKQKIIQALEQLYAGGSTAGAEGIRQAYALAEQAFVKEGNNRIILATDGDFNVGITNPEELQDFVERKREEGVFLSVLGFGQGNYNDHMMQALAQNGNGNAAYIDNLNEARKVLVEEANSTLFTIAKDVKIQVEFNPGMVSEYRLIGYETRHLEREDFNNDAVDAGEVGAGHAVTAIYEITPAGAPKMVDDLRYGEKKAVAGDKAPGGEYAFLKIRYKKPDSDTSTLMTRPVTVADEVRFGDASTDVRFAAAVAGFGQLLKGGKYAGSLSYDQVIEMANAARGNDEFGYRTEFVNLVRLAKSAAALEPQAR